MTRCISSSRSNPTARSYCPRTLPSVAVSFVTYETSRRVRRTRHRNNCWSSYDHTIDNFQLGRRWRWSWSWSWSRSRDCGCHRRRARVDYGCRENIRRLTVGHHSDDPAACSAFLRKIADYHEMIVRNMDRYRVHHSENCTFEVAGENRDRGRTEKGGNHKSRASGFHFFQTRPVWFWSNTAFEWSMNKSQTHWEGSESLHGLRSDTRV